MLVSLYRVVLPVSDIDQAEAFYIQSLWGGAAGGSVRESIILTAGMWSCAVVFQVLNPIQPRFL
jgi:hypothetical protein